MCGNLGAYIHLKGEKKSGFPSSPSATPSSSRNENSPSSLSSSQSAEPNSGESPPPTPLGTPLIINPHDPSSSVLMMESNPDDFPSIELDYSSLVGSQPPKEKKEFFFILFSFSSFCL
jgi:hypothetical protein